MSNVWIENLTINDKPRSLQFCEHCREASFEGIPRARLSFQAHDTGEPMSAYLHIKCVAPFVNGILKSHAALYKAAMRAKRQNRQ